MRVIGHFKLYFEPTGFAAARIDVRALSVVMMPAFAMETVCCSYGTALMKREQPGTLTYHDFVQDTSRRIAHLVKFVDAADAAV